jgi:hypothetical protein
MYENGVPGLPMGDVQWYYGFGREIPPSRLESSENWMMYSEGDAVEWVCTSGLRDDEWDCNRSKEESVAVFSHRGEGEGSATCGGEGGVPDGQRSLKGICYLFFYD